MVKHLIAQWCAAFEAELNFKLWGRRGGAVYAEHVLDGLLRGDLKTRVEASAKRIASGQTTINEERAIENRPEVGGGDVVMVQGAMVPAEHVGAAYGAAAGDQQTDEQEGNDNDNDKD